MTIGAYIAQRIKGFFASFRQDEPQLIEVKCHLCKRNVKIREGMLISDLEKHFQTVEHVEGERRNR